jgi:predicted DCC family thiol-disulfide oxidoreductase YuxK
VATFLYDGDCAFCSSCARFIERRIPTTATVAPWQFTDIDAVGLTVAQCEAAVQWIPEEGPAVAGPVAIAALLRDAGSYWRPLGWLLARRPVLWAVWPVYRWVSRNRHRMPGGTAACSMPQAQRDALGMGGTTPRPFTPRLVNPRPAASPDRAVLPPPA